MIDLHSHILPGIDDGPETIEGSIALARVAVSAGITKTAATPHVNSRFQVSSEQLAELPARLAELEDALGRAGVPLAVVKGAEVALSRLDRLSVDELLGLCLGEGRCVFVESPYVTAAPFVDEQLFGLQAKGFQPVLAHPERCSMFQSEPERVARLVQNGTVCVVNTGSIDGSFGRTVRRFALDLLRDGLVHAVSSDAHDHERRPPGLLEALRSAEAELPDLAAEVGRLTQASPAAILAGEPIPTAPHLERRSGGRLSRLLRRS